MIRYVLCLALSVTVAAAQDSAPHPSRLETNKPSFSPSDISQLQAKANAGDAVAQAKLGKAYKNGNGVPQSDVLALKWLRKAAEQSDASAENDLGIMYRMGQGVSRDKEEAVRWYHKAAKHGSPEGMFNLGVSYYNGEGVASNEATAYAWFLLAKAAGDAAADDAVRRSTATLMPQEKTDALTQIAAMYAEGVELPQNDAESLRWLRKAAEIDPRAKLRLAFHYLTGPDAQHDYTQALELCKDAAKGYPPASTCVGYIYRNGLGGPQDSTEALKWYQRAVAWSDPSAMLDLAEMYSKGEGTKVNRPEAFILLLRAVRLNVDGARVRAREVLKQVDESEIKRVEKRLQDQNLGPEFAAVRSGAPLVR